MKCPACGASDTLFGTITETWFPKFLKGGGIDPKGIRFMPDTAKAKWAEQAGGTPEAPTHEVFCSNEKCAATFTYTKGGGFTRTDVEGGASVVEEEAPADEEAPAEEEAPPPPPAPKPKAAPVAKPVPAPVAKPVAKATPAPVKAPAPVAKAPAKAAAPVAKAPAKAPPAPVKKPVAPPAKK